MDQKVACSLYDSHITSNLLSLIYMCVLKLYFHFNSVPHLKAISVHVLIGLTYITFCTYVYVYNYVNICFTLIKRTMSEISLCSKYVILFKLRHYYYYIIIIIIIIIIAFYFLISFYLPWPQQSVDTLSWSC